jgi:ABC-type nitrate/sulfonate/bicarbonate transport system substrate-binding protein
VPLLRLLGLVLAAATLTAAGCGGSGGGDSRTPRVDVGAFAYDAGDVGDRIAFARLRKSTGIELPIRDLGGVANAVVALVRGDVQLATMPYSTAIRAVDEGAHLRVVLGANMAPELMLVGRGDIGSPGRVGVDVLGFDAEALVRRVLATEGVPLSQVSLVALGDPAARLDALAEGRVDAAVVDEVDYARLRARGERVNVLARLSELRPRSAETVWVVTQSYERTHRALLRRIVRGLLDGYAFLYTATGRLTWLAEARDSVLEDEPAIAERVYAFYRRVRFWPLRDEPVTPEQHRRTVRFWVEAHQLDDAVPFARVWDASFWRAAGR